MNTNTRIKRLSELIRESKGIDNKVISNYENQLNDLIEIRQTEKEAGKRLKELMSKEVKQEVKPLIEIQELDIPTNPTEELKFIMGLGK